MSAKKIKEACESCAFWMPVGERQPGVGECHRHAPRFGQANSDWPLTMNYDFCGDHLYPTRQDMEASEQAQP